MKTLSATTLARNLSHVLDELVRGGEEIAIERHQRIIGRLVPHPPRQNALEALADLYRTLPEAAAQGWEADARRGHWSQRVRDPWHSS
ncbi:MAG: type II toxin-antitoxin system Phd/YefM family antitoxin [Acidobacteria bacterium]|nr:MAG: type II toxin-antitoxin system Phd/YefM family antitoxin [Acidobacteriota bacterium]